MKNSKFFLYKMNNFIKKYQVNQDIIIKMYSLIEEYINIANKIMAIVNEEQKVNIKPSKLTIIQEINDEEFLYNIYYFIINQKEYLIRFPLYVILDTDFRPFNRNYLGILRLIKNKYSQIVNYMENKFDDDDIIYFLNDIMISLDINKNIIDDSDLLLMLNEYHEKEIDINEMVYDTVLDTLIGYDDLINYLLLYIYVYRKDEIKDHLYQKVINYILLNGNDFLEKYNFYVENTINYDENVLFRYIVEDLIDCAKRGKIKRL